MLPRVAAGRTIGHTEHPVIGRPSVDLYPWLKTLHILFAIIVLMVVKPG